MKDEEQAILKEARAFAECWNNGDAKSAASFYTDDGIRVGAFGDVQHGRTEIAIAYNRLLHETMPGARVNQDEGTVRMLSHELAIWQAAIEIVPPDNRGVLKGHVVQVMKKVEGRWLILEAHPKIFPPPPAKR
ncbi:MAG: SgcJ/EcaC family oxidoreductase [Ignavibacteriales bacterium]|nr:SgcJ/EcaC family oxidoreductase [Ignavibacteriales bacterium]